MRGFKHVQARRGQVVFGDPPPVKTCPACLSSDIPAAASKCKYCGTDQPTTTAATRCRRRSGHGAGRARRSGNREVVSGYEMGSAGPMSPVR